MTTLDDALKSFTMTLPRDENGKPGAIIRLDERERKRLVEHLRKQGFEIITTEMLKELDRGLRAE